MHLLVFHEHNINEFEINRPTDRDICLVPTVYDYSFLYS
jgi:hypothetical protein